MSSRGGESAGARSSLVTVQKRPNEDAASDSGYPVEDFTDYAQVYMSKTDALEWDGRAEQFRAGQLSARSYDVWKMPYRPDLDPDDVAVPKLFRLKFRNRVYDIMQADQVDRRYIKLVTLAKVDN